MTREIEKLSGIAREKAGKGAISALRQRGQVPGIIYGAGDDPVLLAIEGRQMEKEMQKHGFFARQYDIVIDGKNHHVLPWEVQTHPVTDHPLHIDFLRVTEKTRVRVAVDVVFINEELSPGLKRGGVLNVVRHQVEIFCAVGSMPEKLTVDLADLDIGDGVHISHIELGEGVEPAIRDRDFTIATIAPPTKAVTEDVLDEEDGEGSEPMRIGEEEKAEGEETEEDSK